MFVESLGYDLESARWSKSPLPALDSPRTLVLAFGAPEVMAEQAPLAELAKAYPRSVLVGCSSAGEIHGTAIQDKSLSVTVTKFDKTDLMLAWVDVAAATESFNVGQSLAKKLLARLGLRGVLVLSEGLSVNGSELVRGLNSVLDESIVVTGGLSGDGTRFQSTWVAIGGKARPNVVAAVGFYGEFVSLGHGSKGGWDKFGPERVVTRSDGNVLYELDGKPALALYKEYLGDRAKDLPSSGLLFPLALRRHAKDDKVLVRTLLAVDHEKSSMTFAGDLPKGSLVQLMKADFDKLIGGASLAGAMAVDTPVGEAGKDRLVIAISCVGRRLVLGDRTEEEVEAVRHALPEGSDPTITGFYSYGEISPYAKGHCDLHNQTMTLTIVAESRVPVPRSGLKDKAAAADLAPDSSVRGAELDMDLSTDLRGFDAAGSRKASSTTPLRRAASVVAVGPGPAEVARTSQRPSATSAPPTARVTPAAKARSAAPIGRSAVAVDVAPTAAPASPRPSEVPVSAVVPKASADAAATGFVVVDRAYDLDTGIWSGPLPALDSPRTLVLAFGAPEVAENTAPLEELARAYPRSVVVGCSSAGEIHGKTVRDRSISAAITRFDKTDLKLVSLEVAGAGDSYAVGQALAKRLLAKPGLRGVLVLSEGLNVNGSDLVRGLNVVLDDTVIVTGGLSGDGTRFKKTWVAIGGKIRPNIVAAIGFYGDHVVIGHGSKGGWDKFGPERVVTRSDANVLYELDGKPALALYKEYLGDRAKDLPASGLLFPLSLRKNAKDEKVLVRTVLAVDHERQSMTFAGDLPKGALVQLMKADFERLIGGASLASAMARDTMATEQVSDRLAIAISCVGRRLVLGDRTEEEIEAVGETLGDAGGLHVTGFYSYGEISPFASGHCDLHNQTMTITVIGESEAPIPRPARSLAPDTPAISDLPTRMAPPPPLAMPELLSNPPSPLPPAVTRGAPATAPPPSVAPPSSVRAPAPARVRPPVATRIPTAGPGIAAPVIAREQRGDVLVVTVAGRLTESFRGEALGRELSGSVVLDLANVERITSFGVREWLTMLGAAAGRANLFLARCPDAVVNQLAMIRSFAGASQVASFFGPYLCEACGEPFERIFDAEDDADVLRGKDPGPATCPRCGGKGRFDDDAKTFFAFALPHAGVPMPPEVRAAIDALAPPEGPKEAVEKTVHGDLTRVHIHRAAKQVRWQRIFDGIEGRLELDIGGANLDADGATSLLRALRALGPEITSIRVERCPRGVLEAHSRGELPAQAEIGSIVCDGYCPSCAAHRPAIVSVADPDARAECKRCGELLEVKDRAAGLAMARKPAPKVAPAEVSSPPLSGPASGPMSGPSATPLPPSVGTRASVVGPAPAVVPAASAAPQKTPVVTIALGIAVVGLLGVLAYAQLRGPAATAATAPAATAAATAIAAPPAASSAAAGDGWMAPADLPPAWSDRPFVAGDPDLTLVGHATGAATPEAAIVDARLDAVRVLLGEVQRQLAPGSAHEFLKQREPAADKRGSPEIGKRFLAQMGSFATPERVDTALRRREQGIEAFVRYKLPKEAFQRVVGEYKDTHRFQGMELGRYFPLLESTIHSASEIVVLSIDKGSAADVLGVRAGDFVTSAGGAPAPSVDALKAQLGDEWARTAPGGAMMLEVESAGAKRAVRFTKPSR